MKLIKLTLPFFILLAQFAVARNCERQSEDVSDLHSERLMLNYINNKPGQNRKSDLELAADLGDPLALSLLASKEDMPIEKKIYYLHIAASVEYFPAYQGLAEFIQQVTMPVPLLEYKFQLIRNAVRYESTYLIDLQELALKSDQRHHLASAIFWSVVFLDPSNKSMGSLQAHENARRLELKLTKPQLNELRTRAILFRCEKYLL